MYSMGIGKFIEVQELFYLASGFDNVFLVKGFDELDQEIDKIQQKLCEGMNLFNFV